MIRLTRLDGEPFVLNADLIRYLEQRPDTFITLTSGDRLVVKETMDEVLDRSVRYQQAKYQTPRFELDDTQVRLASNQELAESSTH